MIFLSNKQDWLGNIKGDILAGYLQLGSLMRFVSRSVETGFVNALACLCNDGGWLRYHLSIPVYPRYWIILPYALGLSVVGLLESMMTATIIEFFSGCILADHGGFLRR